MGRPNIPDLETLYMAGIDPKTRLPLRNQSPCELKDNIKAQLRIIDETDAITRYVWHNLPDDITSDLMERVLYYKGQGAFFKIQDKFFFLPYALDGSIDVYGRYTGITPLPFNGTTKTDEKAWITGLNRKPVYTPIFVTELTEDIWENGCVLLTDYPRQLSQKVLSRQVMNDPLLDVMSEMIPFLRTALMNSTGVQGMRVNNENEKANVFSANEIFKRAALMGDKNIPVVGNVDFQNLTTGTVGQATDFMQALESLDNFRLGLYGIDNGGLFQKKAHMLETEQAMAGGATGLILQQGLTLRQEFCDVVNSIWGIGLYVTTSESVTGTDRNFDGIIEDERDQSGMTGTAEVSEEGEEE